MSRPGATYWHDTFPRSRRPVYPRFRGQAEADVVILGAGLTGCACALSFATAGYRVVVLEADRVGGGATAGSAGIIREAFDASFVRASAALGVRPARSMWSAMRRAALDFAAALRRLGVQCDLAPEDLLTLATGGTDAGKFLRRDYQAQREAGFEPGWLTGASVRSRTAAEAAGAIRTRGARLDPYRACVGLAKAAADRRASIHEGSAVRKLRAGRKLVDVVADGGTIRATAIIITSSAAPGLQGLRRHLRPRHLYTVVTEPLPSAVRREVGPRTVTLRDSADPPHLLRWIDGARALFAGAEQPPVPARLADKVLVQRTGQLMYELSTIYPAISGARPEWSWTTPFDDTVDGLPFIGAHRNFPRQLFALGQGRHGEGVAWLASRLLLRQFANEPAKGDEYFGFGRVL